MAQNLALGYIYQTRTKHDSRDKMTDQKIQTATTAAGLVENVENAFSEQAEYISDGDFLAWSAEHPQGDSIIRRLSSGGAKLLIGPRGCGKTTLMLKAYHSMLGATPGTTLPIYVNFKLSLRLEPLYINTPNATFWFRKWLIGKIYEGAYKTLEALLNGNEVSDLPSRSNVLRFLSDLENGVFQEASGDFYTIQSLSSTLTNLSARVGRQRCVLLLDDAAHAFSPKQQEDFFDFFRQIKSRDIAPKAAIYPGITTHSANFHVGHDAEQIDAWIRPDTPQYLSFMRSLFEKRFGALGHDIINQNGDSINFLAYSAFGVPRSFLNMVRSLQDKTSATTLNFDRRRLLDAAKMSREAAHNVYESLSSKLPAYRNFVENGDRIYATIVRLIKEYNKNRTETDQALEIGIKKPISSNLVKVLSFFQYAGLLMRVGENSRGEKGFFDLYMIHFGDLITENAVIVRRTKSVPGFLKAFAAQTHQVWPRVAEDRLVTSDKFRSLFTLTLPVCQKCGAPRLNEDARFCQNCGAQLKNVSLYEQLINQDISELPITKARSENIKANSSIKTIKDILIDSSRQELRGVPYVGEIWAERITRYAEEHVA